mmetsp:Transcript_33638/g.99754  ORF Transcript_33638/g.99754 Transcript_33638/m.99754 type:complete len:144 (-) Transcript_33638:3880-4311(-)
MAATEAYLEKHGVTKMLDAIVNELVSEKPADPISFLINGLLKEAGKRGQEPALLQRLVELKKTLLSEQAEASKTLDEKAKLSAEVDKLAYRIKHLCKALDTAEANGGGGGGGGGGGDGRRETSEERRAKIAQWNAAGAGGGGD